MNNLGQISVAPQNCSGSPFQTPKRKQLKHHHEWGSPLPPDDWKSMTLLTGIICKDGIVMAADAQQTRSDQKRRLANKITLIEFANAHALIAEAGAALWSQQVIDILKRKAKGIEAVNDETIGQFVAETVRAVSADMRSVFGTSRTTDEDWRDFILSDEYYFELIVAYYHGIKPHLFRVTLGLPVVQKSLTFFQAGGIGRDLAEYLLMEYASPEMEPEFGAAIAIYVTEKVNETNLYCSGHSRLGILQLVPKNLYPENEPLIVLPTILAPEEIADLGAMVLAIENETKAERNRLLKDQLRERTRKMMETLLNPRHPSEDWKRLPPETT